MTDIGEFLALVAATQITQSDLRVTGQGIAGSVVKAGYRLGSGTVQFTRTPIIGGATVDFGSVVASGSTYTVQGTDQGYIIGARPVTYMPGAAKGVAVPVVPIAYNYRDLPKASATPVGTQALVSDWPGAPNKHMVNNGLNWEPFPVAQVRQHINTRDGFGLNSVNLAGNGTQNSFNQGLGLKIGGAATAIKLLYSNTVKANGGAEMTVGTLAPTMETSFGNATKYRNNWDAGGISHTFTDGEEAWATADPALSFTDGQIISLNQHVQWPTVPDFLPATSGNGLFVSTGPFATFDVSARGVNVADLTMGTMPTGRISANLIAPKAITGLTVWRPVVALAGDSNRLWARQALAQLGIRWLDIGNDGWTMESLAADSLGTTIRLSRLVEIGVTHLWVTMSGGDVTGGKSVATIRGYRNAIAAKCKAMGLIPHFSTTPPKATDTTNTAVDPAKWAVIQGVNNEVRTLGEFGYIELFLAVGDPATGLFNASLGPNPTVPQDGIHMTQATHDVATAYVLPQMALVFKQG